MRTLTDRSGQLPAQEQDRGDHRTVVVVGAGITGLVAAYELRRRGVNVTLYEASAHAGGAIRTSHVDGFVAEHGPNSFVANAATASLLAQLDLRTEVVEADRRAARRYVVRDGRLEAFPLSPPALLSTRLLSLRAKLRVLLEPLVRPRRDGADESIAAFVRRRLGREVLDYAVDPFVSGIFAGDPEQLSMAHAFPRVLELERTHGSLSRGLMRQRRLRPAAPATEPDAGDGAPSPHGRLVSFVDGMQTLTDALEAALVGTLRLGCPVRLLHRDETHWVVDAGPDGSTRSRRVDAVVMATPAHVLAAMELPAALRRYTTAIEQVEYPPVSTLTLGFRRGDVAHPLDGFGMLVPTAERRSLLGALFSSSLFPERAPEGCVALTCFVGGARRPQLALESEEVLVDRVLHDLRDLLGVTGAPVFVQHVRWPRAIPQYTLGYDAVKQSADAVELANPGFYLAGNYRHGVSVGDCIVSGQLTAERVAAYLTRAG
jgi:oxygen-dependent protoporphyrinogen oxidase